GAPEAPALVRRLVGLEAQKQLPDLSIGGIVDRPHRQSLPYQAPRGRQETQEAKENRSPEEGAFGLILHVVGSARSVARRTEIWNGAQNAGDLAHGQHPRLAFVLSRLGLASQRPPHGAARIFSDCTVTPESSKSLWLFG